MRTKMFVLFLLAGSALAAGPAYTVKSHRVNEDERYIYYSDTLSTGVEKTRRVVKPKPKEYPQSATLIATNDMPVMIQYIYSEVYADGSIKTNYQYRTKTSRERARITLPPMPEITPPDPRIDDALGQAVKRSRISEQPALDGVEIRDTKTMKRVDRAIKSRVENGRVIYTMQSGKEISKPLKKAYTAKVKAASVRDTSGGGSAKKNK